MLLKGLYDTATDRLPIEDFKKVMFKRFYINIEEPAGYGSYSGFIKRNPCYDIYIPYLEDGKIAGLMRNNCRRYSAAGVVDLKLKIKALIKEDPERFKQLAQAVAENEEMIAKALVSSAYGKLVTASIESEVKANDN